MREEKVQRRVEGRADRQLRLRNAAPAQHILRAVGRQALVAFKGQERAERLPKLSLDVLSVPDLSHAYPLKARYVL